MNIHRKKHVIPKTSMSDMCCPLCRDNTMGDKVVQSGVWVRRCKRCGFEKNFTPKEKR